MKLSPYFHDLRSAYQAELDDLASDSEGNDVLRRRLAEKRNEIVFLAQMLEMAPEMVAVVFHRGFRFHQSAALERMLACGLGDVPTWGELASAVALEPWARSLADVVLQQPEGARFLSVAAGLEYLHQHARLAAAAAHVAGPAGLDDDIGDAESDDRDDEDDDGAHLSADDAMEPQSSRERDEASANWLADAGFDRKE